jgi:8-oxo-dGTP pyrophosphatase MutT (NUDIX family)
MKIRTAAKALIVQDKKLLVLEYNDTFYPTHDTYFVLPGGGQHHSEPLDQTLRRECLEEINVDVEVKDLMLIREYIGKNHSQAARHTNIHQVEFFFRCTIRAGQPGIGHTPDTGQIGVQWVALDTLESSNFYPQAARKTLAALFNGEEIPSHPVYLGDID